METFLRLKSLKTNGANIIKWMFFIVFSSATFLHWCLFLTWSTLIGERPNHKVISVWNPAEPPWSKPTWWCNTRVWNIWGKESAFISPGCNRPSCDLSSNVMNTLSIGKFWFNIIKNFIKDLESEIVCWCCVNNSFCLFKYDLIKIKMLKIKFREIWFTPVINLGSRIIIQSAHAVITNCILTSHAVNLV